MALIEKLAAIANAIRSKTGKTDGLTLEQMPGEIEGIETGGVSEQDLLEAMATRDWPSGDIVINAEKILDNAFVDRKKITSVIADNATELGYCAFSGCDSLLTADFPEVTIVNEKSLAYCTALTTLNLPELTTITGYNSFRANKALTWMTLPKLAEFKGTVFYPWGEAKALKVLDIGPALGNFKAGQAFISGYGPIVLVLRYDGVCVLNSVENVAGSVIRNGRGYLLIPSAHLEEYKVATNWSSLLGLGDEFLALEDYTVDGTVTGALDVVKIEELIAE